MKNQFWLPKLSKCFHAYHMGFKWYFWSNLRELKIRKNLNQDDLKEPDDLLIDVDKILIVVFFWQNHKRSKKLEKSLKWMIVSKFWGKKWSAKFVWNRFSRRKQVQNLFRLVFLQNCSTDFAQTNITSFWDTATSKFDFHHN